MLFIQSTKPKLYVSQQEALQLIEDIARASRTAPDHAGRFCSVEMAIIGERERDANQFPSSLTIIVTST